MANILSNIQALGVATQIGCFAQVKPAKQIAVKTEADNLYDSDEPSDALVDLRAPMTRMSQLFPEEPLTFM